MKVEIEIERRAVVPLSYAEVEPLLADVEGTIGRFPKLKKLTPLGGNAYLWEMKTIGSRMVNIAHEVSYGARYHVDLPRGEMRWDAVPGKGNATIEGSFRLLKGTAQTELLFRVRGELREIPVPLMYRLIAPPFIQGKFTKLVDTFLEDTRAAVLEGKLAKRGRKAGV